MSRKFVIAGNREQANAWIKNDLTKRQNAGETTLSWSDYVIVNDPIKVRGVRDPQGVFIGTWKDRIDIEEIVDNLFMSCSKVNKGLEYIREEVKKLGRKKPTPKIQGINTQSVFIDEAADILANEIDKQVIQGLTKPQPMMVDTNTLLAQCIAAIQELNAKVERLENARNLPTS